MNNKDFLGNEIRQVDYIVYATTWCRDPILKYGKVLEIKDGRKFVVRGVGLYVHKEWPDPNEKWIKYERQRSNSLLPQNRRIVVVEERMVPIEVRDMLNER